MSNRFGFMVSTKAGKCMLCRCNLTIGESCAMDNSCKRRVCVSCANGMISAGHDVLVDKRPTKGQATASQIDYTALLKRIADALEGKPTQVSTDYSQVVQDLLHLASAINNLSAEQQALAEETAACIKKAEDAQFKIEELERKVSALNQMAGVEE